MTSVIYFKGALEFSEWIRKNHLMENDPENISHNVTTSFILENNVR